MPNRKHNQAKPDQVQWHSLNWPRMLHPDDGSCDLGRLIWNSGDSDKNHWLDRRTDRPGWANTEVIHLMIQGLRTKCKVNLYASEQFKELDQTTLAEAHWTFTSPAAMIQIAVAIFLIGVLIWKKCFWNQEPPAQVLSAPPMPMPITNVGPTYKAMNSNAQIPISISIS